jgi:hypothetical protein
MALGLRRYWDGYFVGPAAPLRRVPAEAADAVFDNFAGGEVRRHIPACGIPPLPRRRPPARERGSVSLATLRRVLDDRADAPGLARPAELATTAASSAPTQGLVLYAALRRLPVPEAPVAWLCHAATLLHVLRGDGPAAARVAEGIGGTETHALLALSERIPGKQFGRVHHLPEMRLTAVVEGMRTRGLIEVSGLAQWSELPSARSGRP